MEPSALENSKWELLFNQYSQRINSSSEHNVISILEEIDRKIDKIADAIFSSSSLSAQFKTLIDLAAKKCSSPPAIIITVCFSIIDRLNTRVPGFIIIPSCLHTYHLLETEEKINKDTLFQLNILLKKEPISKSLLENFELLFWKCLATLKNPEHKRIFHQYTNQMLSKIDKYLINPEERILSHVENILEIIISNTDQTVAFESLFYFMKNKPNEIFWTYILKKIDYIGQPVSFKRLKLHLSSIIKILNLSSECCHNFKKYMNSHFLVFQIKENQRDFRDNYVRFFDFYRLLIRLCPDLSNPVIAKYCTETIELRLKNGPLHLFLYQHELLQNIEGYTKEKLLDIPRKKFRLMLKHFYQLSLKVSNLPIDDVLTLAELAKFLNHSELRKQTAEKIHSFAESLPKNKWRLYEDDSFNALINLMVSLINLNLHEHLKICRKCLWPPIPEAGSPLVLELLKSPENTHQFSLYMRQLGYLCWLTSHYFPQVSENKENTLLELANSFVSWFLTEIFELLEDKIYSAHVPVLLKLLQTNLQAPHQIVINTKAINSSPELIKEESLIELNLTHCTLWSLNDLRALEGLPLKSIIINKTMSAHVNQIKHIFPGFKITNE